MPKPRCKVQIWKKDCYRRTGRGSSGFEMHYNQQQCSRAAVADGRCRQHSADKFPNATLLDWHEFLRERQR